MIKKRFKAFWIGNTPSFSSRVHKPVSQMFSTFKTEQQTTVQFVALRARHCVVKILHHTQVLTYTQYSAMLYLYGSECMHTGGRYAFVGNHPKKPPTLCWSFAICPIGKSMSGGMKVKLSVTSSVPGEPQHHNSVFLACSWKADGIPS